jgi:zinc/manganese transport system permease protein
MSFAVHGTAELAFTGGAAALLAGIGVQLGAGRPAVVAGVVGLLGLRQRERDSGRGRARVRARPRRADARALSRPGVEQVRAGRVDRLHRRHQPVGARRGGGRRDRGAAVFHRRLLFASADAGVATARGVPVRMLSLIFAVLIGLVTALAVPVVGAILVLSVMIAPGPPRPA